MQTSVGGYYCESGKGLTNTGMHKLLNNQGVISNETRLATMVAEQGSMEATLDAMCCTAM